MRRRGTVLLAVLVVAAMVAMIAAGLLFRVTAEVSASVASVRGQQAYAAAMSGLQQAIAVLRLHGAEPEVWRDAPELFRNQLVCDDGIDRWYFTIYAQNPADRWSVRYGLTDEAGKVNLNTATEEMLRALPDMTDELVDCLLDYRDSDDETRPSGAEQDYYATLQRPYLIPNGALGTLEELLLVRGFDAQIVWGEDANLNGLLEANEDDGDDSFPPDDRDGWLNTGLGGVATVVSRSPSRQQQAQAKIDINNARADYSDVTLPEQTIEFIGLYLGEGNRFTHPSELLEMRYRLRNDPNGIEDLKAGDWIESGVGRDELPTVMERLTTEQAAQPAPGGWINVNAASEAVLRTLPGVDESAAAAIVSIGRDLPDETKANLAWLYTEGAVDAETFKAIAPMLSTRGYQFHVRCVGFGSPSGRYCILEAIVDVAESTPRIVYLRDITRVGLPFALNPEELEL